MNSLKTLLVSTAILASATAAVATEAPVANLLDMSGKVMIDRGHGFASVSDQSLKAGDRIFVGDKSSAVVAYAGCSVKLAEPTVFVVGKTAPCAKGASVVKIGSVLVAPAADVPVGAGAAGAGAGGLGGLGPLVILPPVILAGGLFFLLSSKS